MPKKRTKTSQPKLRLVITEEQRALSARRAEAAQAHILAIERVQRASKELGEALLAMHVTGQAFYSLLP